MRFETLDEAIECYGRENLVAIDCIKQIIFYTANGCQPKFVFEHENKEGKISAWFLKDETSILLNLLSYKILNAQQI